MEKNKCLRNIVSKTKIVIMIVIIIFGLLIMMMQVLPVKTRIKYLGFQPMVILTDSMTGELEQGDFIVLKRVKVTNLAVGDIISFYADLNNDGQKEIVTHYLANIEESKTGYIFRTKPNISNRLDTWEIYEHDFIGKLWFHIPKIGGFIANKHLKVGTGITVSIISFSLAIYLATSKISFISDDRKEDVTSL